MTKNEFLEKIKTHSTLIHARPVDIDELDDCIKRYTDIDDSEIILQFSRKYENIYFSRIENESNDKLTILICPSAAPCDLKHYSVNKEVIRVAYVKNASGIIQHIFMSQQGHFYSQDGLLIADGEDDLLQYLLTVEFDYHAAISELTYKLLKEAGWYEGRRKKIDNAIAYYEQSGTPLSASQIAFLEEFGDIKGVDSRGDLFVTHIDPKCYFSHAKNKIISYHKRHTLDSPEYMSPINLVAFRENVDMLRVGYIGNLMIPLWLSSDGRLFADQGVQLGRTIMEGWQKILNR